MGWKKLGHSSYQEYLKSQRWNEIKEAVFSYYGRCCYFCGETRSIQCHHLSYGKKTIMNAQLHNLIPLCEHCHSLVSNLAKNEGIDQREATRIIAKQFHKELHSKRQITKNTYLDKLKKKAKRNGSPLIFYAK